VRVRETFACRQRGTPQLCYEDGLSQQLFYEDVQSHYDNGQSRHEDGQSLFSQVVLIELFAGLLAGSLAAENLGIPVAASYYAEKDKPSTSWSVRAWSTSPLERGFVQPGSRTGVDDPVAASVDIALTQRPFPASLRELVYALPEAWSRHWARD